MSDTRSSSFPVPAPRGDDASSEAGETTAGGGPEERRAGPGPESRAPEEDAPTARWPVPDYAEPPTGAWDRHRPRVGDDGEGALWPVAESSAPAPRPGPHDDDPETFTFDRPSWETPPPPSGAQTWDGAQSSGPQAWDQAQASEAQAWQQPQTSEAQSRDHSQTSGAQAWDHAQTSAPQAWDPPQASTPHTWEQTSAPQAWEQTSAPQAWEQTSAPQAWEQTAAPQPWEQRQASGPQGWDAPTPPAGRPQAPPPVPAWEAPPPRTPAAPDDGFSYWERPQPPRTSAPPAQEAAPGPQGFDGPRHGGGPAPSVPAAVPGSVGPDGVPVPYGPAGTPGQYVPAGAPGQFGPSSGAPASYGQGAAHAPYGRAGFPGDAGGRPPGAEAAWDAPAPETEEAQPAGPPAKRPREPYLDNVKFLLIALVPTGHALVPTLATHSSRSAYLFIYVFHMPLFVLISGYLSRNFWNSNAKTNKLVDTFLVPYVVVEVGYAVLRFAFGHKFSLTIIDPAWLNWYLLALLLWRLSTPVWKRMRYPLPIAVAVYLLAGLSDLPGDFSMDRFFGLMPFFVLGLLLQPHHFEMLNRLWVKIVAVVALVGAAGVAILISPKVPLDPIYYKDSYADLDLSWWMGMAMRVGLLVAALVVSVAILALVPRKRTWFSDLGTRTLYCYLLHGVPVYIAKEMGWLSFPWLHGPLGVMAIASSSFALAIVLCLPETRTLFKWLLEPRLVWLYRRPSAQAGAPER
ncbi:hypothetical protein Ssi03_07060 [Sphaerisporangium siamense]|uniref:Fucose 4-O-acetylase-like acetyltransferase n=1 Tax=Sphaerisporangium siamense TaxID=795645 RepID=A0A7W7DH42_9ACTN|nr:acyltransferase family protein [Sphaerisporangium siamense]MBB4705890.1 fucose 4-O-acetylase-like acetyltransferase [Sphaerisporangium siamense]GII82716.1 hypothetical protein Ssi03_07060 [Sphaerisporangium siamense]